MKQRVLFKVVSKKNKSLIINARSKYCLSYEKGKKVKALEGTLGIFCFKYRIKAEGYARYWGGKVLRVTPIGKVKKPKYICKTRYSKEITKFYNQSFTYTRTQDIPPGTVVCSEIKVLE